MGRKMPGSQIGRQGDTEGTERGGDEGDAMFFYLYF